MTAWQRPARIGLASFAVTFGVTLLYSMSDRAGPPAAAPVAPLDPDAVLESRGARITFGDGSVIVADQQFAYEDGSARLVGVEVIVPAEGDRTGFRIRGGEASGAEETGDWRLTGAVAIETEDGLAGNTSEASYADASGVVTMPGRAGFEQGWMRLAGDAARYDSRGRVVHLERQAVVELRLEPDGDAPDVRIAARSAEVDRFAGVMRFRGAVTVDSDGRRMQADRVAVRFDPDASRLDAIALTGGARVRGQGGEGTDLREMSAEAISVTYRDDEPERAALTGGARILGGDEGPGQLRDLSAPEIGVEYRDGAPERADLAGGARVELFGSRPGAAGVTIAGGSVEVALQPGAAGVDALRARERVTLEFPADGGAARRIRARTLDIGSAGAQDAQPAAAAGPGVPAAAPAAGTGPGGGAVPAAGGRPAGGRAVGGPVPSAAPATGGGPGGGAVPAAGGQAGGPAVGGPVVPSAAPATGGGPGRGTVPAAGGRPGGGTVPAVGGPVVPSAAPAAGGGPGGGVVPAGGPAAAAVRSAVFDGDVELLESDVSEAPDADDRLMRADRMEATLAAGLGRLTGMRLLGNVTLEAGDIRAEADAATYAPDEALFTLLATPAADRTPAARQGAARAEPASGAAAPGRTPRLDDQRGFLQAETISVGLDGPNVEALQNVKGVLDSAETEGASAAVRPGLFAAGPPIHVVAGRFAYDAATSLATYSNGARLWQGTTEFRGQSIVIDETTGDVTAEGAVRTRTTLLQNDAESEDAVESITEGRAERLFFDNRLQQVAYNPTPAVADSPPDGAPGLAAAPPAASTTPAVAGSPPDGAPGLAAAPPAAGTTTPAVVSSPGFTLDSESIVLFLRADARTLGRIEAAGSVALDLETRRVTGETLSYDDGEGRYDLTGEPVTVVEELEEGCRQTTGQSVTFFANGESISADGRSAERTASTSATCPA